jgi:proteasome lid subunit RPN8/RPN11/phage tail protein X
VSTEKKKPAARKTAGANTVPAKKRPFTVRISDDIMEGIERHAYSLLTAEVGGMLVGKVTGKTTVIEGFIPALSASAEQVTLTFTHDVWEEILKVAAKDFPGKQIIGWYHTHPTFGVFLSEYDMFIQENFFGQKGHVALVIDPVQGTRGWFGKDAEGTVVTFDEGPTSTGPKRAIDPPLLEESSRTTSGVKLAAVGLVALVVGGAIGAGVMATQMPPDLSSALAQSRAETDAVLDESALLQESIAQVFAEPVVTYRTRHGDTISNVTIRFYTDFPSGREALLLANGLDGSEDLTPGQWLMIPGPTKLGLIPISATEYLELMGEQDSSDSGGEADGNSGADEGTQ